jgi:hypothetical protein
MNELTLKAKLSIELSYLELSLLLRDHGNWLRLPNRNHLEFALVMRFRRLNRLLLLLLYLCCWSNLMENHGFFREGCLLLVFRADILREAHQPDAEFAELASGLVHS